MSKSKSESNGETVRATPYARHAFSPRYPVRVSFEGPGRTKQSFKDECDINRIMGRYAVTGTLDFVNQREARFEDVSEVDFQSAMQLVAESREAFMSLPSTIRSRFNNDPGKLLGFLEDPSNLDEAIKLGLVNKPLPVQNEDKLPGAVGAAGGAAS